ncbi:MAG: sigma-70 family RNA polymerase sigma factor [Planctomycetaceae bacterium]|nr:sigma-70 family RNA polymerase sigma factor [Planctomycetaceae bacterium]
MALSEFDRNLLTRCIARSAGAWEEFVDRYIGLTYHTIRQTAKSRTSQISSHDEEDYAAEVFLQIIKNDFAVLRRFRGNSSLATYLAIIIRRIVVREFVNKRHPRIQNSNANGETENGEGEQSKVYAFKIPLDQTAPLQDQQPLPEEQAADRDAVANILNQLVGKEREVVEMYHLEGRTYYEISRITGLPENSIGPTLSRARARLRQR